MKNILFLLICFLLATQCAHAQNFTRDGYPADSLGVSGDTAFYIAVGYKLLGTYETYPALNEDGVDSATVARFAFRFIQENESKIAEANRAVLKQRELTKGYPQANNIINRFSGQGYLETAWGEFQSRFAGNLRALKELERTQRVYQDVNQAINAVSGGNYFTILRQQPNIQQRYVGFYRINYAGNTKYVEFRTNGAAREVNAQGQPVQGGLTGSWQPLSDNSFYLNNFLPVENLPLNTRLIAEQDGGNIWFADGVNVRLVKAQQ